MLCTNSITTSFVGDIFFPSFWIWEISRCFSSAATIVTQPALSHFANLLDSSKFFISPFTLLKMLAFFGDMFPLKQTALKHNQNEMRHGAAEVPPLQQFRPFFDYGSQILTALCSAPPKSCPNQKSFWDPSNQHPNTTGSVGTFITGFELNDDTKSDQRLFYTINFTGMGWTFWFLKKTCLAGTP